MSRDEYRAAKARERARKMARKAEKKAKRARIALATGY